MKIKTRRVAMASAAVALVLPLAACGNSNGDESTTTTADQASPATEAAGNFGPDCATFQQNNPSITTGMEDDPFATAAGKNPELATLTNAVGKAELIDTVNGVKPGTVFAPVNRAFAKIPAETLNSVLEDKPTLMNILTLHVVKTQKLTESSFTESGAKVASVQGGELTLKREGEDFTVTDPQGNKARVLCGGVQTDSGPVHLIDTVLMPAAEAKQ